MNCRTRAIRLIFPLLKISDRVIIPSSEIQMKAVRSTGAGGQNVNKVATAIAFKHCSNIMTVISQEIAWKNIKQIKLAKASSTVSP